LGKEMRVRHDRIDRVGTVSLRYRSRLYCIGVGRVHKGRRVILLVAGTNIRVLSDEGNCCGN
jgi:hypothetical protein